MVNMIQASKHNNPNGIATTSAIVVAPPARPTPIKSTDDMSIPRLQLISLLVRAFTHLLLYTTFDLNAPLLFSINV